jgi:hypothetical protein
MEALKRMFPGTPGSPLGAPPLRPRSAAASPRWAIRAASFSAGAPRHGFFINIQNINK